MKPEQPIIAFNTAAEFRRWLKKHHSTHPGIWMQIAKKSSGLKSITYPEALDEALCYGWIDGQKKSHDAATWLQKFTRRSPHSAWSKANTGHVNRLTREGRMQPAGQSVVDAAKADGRWAKALASSRNHEVPGDFLAALAKQSSAQAHFESLNKANRNAIGYLLSTAKKSETRARRFAKLISMMNRREKIYGSQLR